jgi:hypothetical protein
VRQERLPGWPEESCRPHDYPTQTPSGGLWHAGGFGEAHCLADMAEELLERWVLASRCCLVVVLQSGRLLLAPANVVQLYWHWCSRALRTAHLSLRLGVVHLQRRPRPHDLGSRTLLPDSSGRWSYGRSEMLDGPETAPSWSGGNEPRWEVVEASWAHGTSEPYV